MESFPIDPNAPPTAQDYLESGKENRLLTWLASGAPVANDVSNNFVSGALDHPITLWGEGSLGSAAPLRNQVAATAVPVSNFGQGALAWAVLDEGVKLRVNTGTRDRTNSSSRFAQLGSGVRPATEMIQGLESFTSDLFEDGSEDAAMFNKAATLESFELASSTVAGTQKENIKQLLHDITPFSRGVLSDTARGGLHTDFSLFTSTRGAGNGVPELYSH